MSNPSPEELLTELQRVTDELGESPSAAQMREYGSYSPRQYRYRFGSWNAAKEAAGLDFEGKSTPLTEDNLIRELQRLAEELGKSPTLGELASHGNYSQEPYLRIWETWNDALVSAGLESNQRKKISDEELLEEIRSLAQKLGKEPSQREMDAKGAFSAAVYRKRFGSWSKAKALAFE